VLEDGYVQLGSLPAEALKGTVRVEFVNETGLAEAGIDRMGVFKEFLEETLKKAFNIDRGLFVLTEAQRLCPSATSELADPNHLRMFEFIGRMLGKALYEGLVLEVPLAEFFVLKLLGRYPNFDQLPSLDKQLHASLEMLKQYDAQLGELQETMAHERASIRTEMAQLEALNQEYQELVSGGGGGISRNKIVSGIALLVGLTGVGAALNEALRIALAGSGDVVTLGLNAALGVAGVGYHLQRK